MTVDQPLCCVEVRLRRETFGHGRDRQHNPRPARFRVLSLHLFVLVWFAHKTLTATTSPVQTEAVGSDQTRLSARNRS